VNVVIRGLVFSLYFRFPWQKCLKSNGILEWLPVLQHAAHTMTYMCITSSICMDLMEKAC
jgi:hypothetical protein